MVTFSTTLSDILVFADKYGADITELLRLISRVASQSGMRIVGPSRPNLPAPADRVRNPGLPVAESKVPAKPSPAAVAVALSDKEMFSIVQQRWLAEPDGLMTTGRAYYRRCGFVMPRNSKRFANWLLREAGAGGDVVGLQNGRYVFRRSTRGLR